MQYCGHLMRRTGSFEKILMLGKIESRRRRRGWQRMRRLDGIMDSKDVSLSKLRELVMGQEAWVCCSPWGLKELYTTEWQNWTELNGRLEVHHQDVGKFGVSWDLFPWLADSPILWVLIWPFSLCAYTPCTSSFSYKDTSSTWLGPQT